MADDPTVIQIKTIGRLANRVETTSNLINKVKSLSNLVVPVSSIGEFPDLDLPPTGTLTLNSIVIASDPGEVLFDYTTSDPDGTVAKIELLRKESAEPGFTEVAEILIPGASGQITDTAVPQGTYEYKLLITDDESLTGESNVVAGIVILGGVIDFSGGDIVFANDTFVPSSGTRLKAYKAGIGSSIEQLSGDGKTITTTGSQNAFFAAQNNVPGTWNIAWDLAYTPADTNANFQTMAIINSLHTAGFDPDANDVIVAFVYDRFDGTSANVRMQYHNGVTTVQLAVLSGALPFGTKIRCAIDKGIINPLEYNFTFDVGGILGTPVVEPILISLVNLTRTNAFLHGPDPYVAGFPHNATDLVDNIAGLL